MHESSLIELIPQNKSINCWSLFLIVLKHMLGWKFIELSNQVKEKNIRKLQVYFHISCRLKENNMMNSCNFKDNNKRIHVCRLPITYRLIFYIGSVPPHFYPLSQLSIPCNEIWMRNCYRRTESIVLFLFYYLKSSCSNFYTRILLMISNSSDS